MVLIRRMSVKLSCSLNSYALDCRFQMAVGMTKFDGKLTGLSIILVFKDFRVAISDCGQKFNFLRPLCAVQSRIPAALSTSRSHNA
jgi:hypothetical protein